MAIKNENFILIQGWMINNLKLAGNDLLVYAIIYGFTQEGEQWFEGSRSYLSEWCNSTKQGIQKNLKRLVESKLILKKETFINNVKFCKYKVNPEHTPQKEKNGVNVPKGTPSQHSLPGATVAPSQQSLLGGRQQSCPNNIDIDNINNNIESKKESSGEKFFAANKKKNLDSTQVSDSPLVADKKEKTKQIFDSLIDEYTNNEDLRNELKKHLKTRKLKKAALTNQAIELSLSKLNKIAAGDYEKIQIVRNSIMNGWTGFFPLKKDEHNRLISSLSQHKLSYDIEAYESMNVFGDWTPEDDAKMEEFNEDDDFS